MGTKNVTMFAYSHFDSYTSVQANYLTIPVYVLACFTLLLASFISDKLNRRAMCAFFVPIPVLIGYIIVIATPNIGAGYFAMFLCAAGKLSPSIIELWLY